MRNTFNSTWKNSAFSSKTQAKSPTAKKSNRKRNASPITTTASSRALISTSKGNSTASTIMRNLCLKPNPLLPRSTNITISVVASTKGAKILAISVLPKILKITRWLTTTPLPQRISSLKRALLLSNSYHCKSKCKVSLSTTNSFTEISRTFIKWKWRHAPLSNANPSLQMRRKSINSIWKKLKNWICLPMPCIP